MGECQKFGELLPDYVWWQVRREGTGSSPGVEANLDGGVDPSVSASGEEAFEAFEGHLGRCGDCRRAVDRERRFLEDLVEGLEVQSVLAPDLSSQVLGRIATLPLPHSHSEEEISANGVPANGSIVAGSEIGEEQERSTERQRWERSVVPTARVTAGASQPEYGDLGGTTVSSSSSVSSSREEPAQEPQVIRRGVFSGRLGELKLGNWVAAAVLLIFVPWTGILIWNRVSLNQEGREVVTNLDSGADRSGEIVDSHRSGMDESGLEESGLEESGVDGSDVEGPDRDPGESDADRGETGDLERVGDLTRINERADVGIERAGNEVEFRAAYEGLRKNKATHSARTALLGHFLGEMPWNPSPGEVDVLLAVLADPTDVVREDVLQGLGGYSGSRVQRVGEVVGAELMKEPSRKFMVLAFDLEALRLVDRKALPRGFVDMIRNLEDSILRAFGAALLANRGEPEGYAFFVEVLWNRLADSRSSMAWELLRQGRVVLPEETLRDAVKNVLSFSSDYTTRGSAIQAILRQFGPEEVLELIAEIGPNPTLDRDVLATFSDERLPSFASVASSPAFVQFFTRSFDEATNGASVVRCLALFGEVCKEASLRERLLGRLSQDRSTADRLWVLSSLSHGELEKTGQVASEFLTALQNSDPKIREQALFALAEFDVRHLEGEESLYGLLEAGVSSVSPSDAEESAVPTDSLTPEQRVQQRVQQRESERLEKVMAVVGLRALSRFHRLPEYASRVENKLIADADRHPLWWGRLAASVFAVDLGLSGADELLRNLFRGSSEIPSFFGVVVKGRSISLATHLDQIASGSDEEALSSGEIAHLLAMLARGGV